MKMLFIINPAAGSGVSTVEVKNQVRSVLDSIQEVDFFSSQTCITEENQFSIYITEYPGDAEKKAEHFATYIEEHYPGETGRIYVFGGDGTLHEVINGIMGRDSVAAGVVPCGTGNDFIKNFDNSRAFDDLGCQIRGEESKVDLIQYSGKLNGIEKTRYCCNMFNIGFDCNVVALAAKLKKLPLIAGPFAYFLAIIGTFIAKEGVALRMYTEGREIRRGSNLLCCVGNGMYCGGFVCASPESNVDDGIFELNAIDSISRWLCIKMFNQYKKGTYYETEIGNKVACFSRCKALTLRPFKDGDTFNLCVDGEISVTEGVDMKIVPSAVNFILPEKRKE